ncbi:MAG: MGH1-like glycoside hydrolase domain-containing protein, partial [Sphingobacterium sp.]
MRLSHIFTPYVCFVALGFLSSSVVGCKIQKDRVYQTELESIKNRAQLQLRADAAEFNNYKDRPESDGPFHAGNNQRFLTDNVPLFISSDVDFTRVYNYRWWMISKHLKQYRDPHDGVEYWVVTEFFGDRPWATLSGAITCPAGHQFYDVRWLRDAKYIKSYADYYMRGSASYLSQRENGNFLTYKERPESHHFSSWMIDGVEAFLKIHPDPKWQRGLLPSLEYHQQMWDSLFTVQNPQSKTAGMYKILDLYDGMEFSLSAVLGLIESKGAYSLYTDENWRNYYLGWATTNTTAASKYAEQYPKAFRKGYPDFYLSRPSINSYAYGNLASLSTLYSLQHDEASLQKAKLYHQRAARVQQSILSILWNEQDQFFYTTTAGDNQYGVSDFQAHVRESVGYTPWYFNLIPFSDQARYEKAWDMFSSKQGFANQAGMTTAERQHPYYNEQAYAWNGRGWPFQNSIVYKSYANYLRNYKDTILHEDRELLYNNIEQLVHLHGKNELNIGE